MSEKFDPYHTWLGISPHEQPPHFYRLLGIGLFESDPAVIAGAADRQMAYVRTFQAGPRGAHTQKLLNELAKARHSLLDPQERAAYDQWLRNWLASGAGHAIARPAPPPHAAVAPPLAPLASPPRSEPARLPVGKLAPQPAAEQEEEPQRATSPWFWVLAGVVGLLSSGAIVALILVLFNRRPEPAPIDPNPVTPPVVEKPVEPEAPKTPKIVETEQEGSGDVELVASAAQREGEAAIVELGGSSAIDGLHASTDKLRWDFRLARPGFFRVIVSYSAEAASVGGRYRVSVGDKKVEASVRDSGGAGEVAKENIGILVVQKSGRHTLEFAPVSVSGQRLMVLHSIRLIMRP